MIFKLCCCSQERIKDILFFTTSKDSFQNTSETCWYRDQKNVFVFLNLLSKFTQLIE